MTTPAEARKQVEDAAQKIVQSVVKSIGISHDESATTRELFADRDLSYYDATATELEALGFRMLGAHEPTAWREKPVAERNFSEFALGEDDRAVANWWVVQSRTGPRNSLAFQSFMLDGSVVATARNITDAGLPWPPGREPALVGEDVDTAALLAMHQQRVAAQGSMARRFATIYEIMAARQEDTLRTAEYRRSLGAALFEPILRKRFTGDQAKVADVFMQVIRAHPEWMKAE